MKAKISNAVQIMVFQLNDKEFYGIEVSNIKSIESYTRYKVSKNEMQFNNNSEILEGDINYHKKIVPFLNVEKWTGLYKEENSYLETIVCEIENNLFAFPIADINNIYNIPRESIDKKEDGNRFLSFSTLIKVEEEEVVCRVLDFNKLLSDVFP